MSDGPLPAWALANTVTAYATCLAGVLTLALAWLMRPRQPARWLAAYAGILITGIATVWYHGFGETFEAGLADGGTNLLLAWLLQVAVLGDYYGLTTGRPRAWLIALSSASINLAATVWKIAVGPAIARRDAISFGSFGGFHVNEVVLILNAFLIVGLFYARRRAIPLAARPLLNLTTAFFLVGLLLATASNQQIGFHILPYHATWHLVSAFGFIALWAFNHARLSAETKPA